MHRVIIIRSIILGLFGLMILMSITSFRTSPPNYFGVIQDYDASLSNQLIGKWALVKTKKKKNQILSEKNNDFLKVILTFDKDHALKIVKQTSDTTVSEIRKTKYKIRLEMTREEEVKKFLMLEREWGMVQFKKDTLILDYSYINQTKEYYIKQMY